MISVIIPSYNRSRLLKRAIDSALAQTVCASEIIVVDDGSTDNTSELCAGYGNQIKYVKQKNAGASVARNTGAMLAGCSWLAFLDSDDYWTPYHLERMVKAIEKTDGQARFYFSDMQMREGNDCITLWQTIKFAPPHPVHLTKDGTNWVFLARQPTMLQCSVFRRDVWMKYGGLDPRLHLKHDSELFYRLGIGGKICAVSGVGCVQTEDDVSKARLTSAVDPRDAQYWEESIILWRNLARASRNLSSKYRRIARFRLASCYWRLVRLHWSSGNLGASLWYFCILGWSDPFFVISLLARRRASANRAVVLPEFIDRITHFPIPSHIQSREGVWGLFTRKERWGLSWRGRLILALLGFSTVSFLLFNMQPFLAETQRVNSNILVVEGWIHDYGIRGAAEEFRRGSYERVFTTGGPVVGNGGYINDFQTSASVGADLLKNAAVPPEVVQMVPSRVMDRDRTYGSAVALREWFRVHNMAVHSVNVVTENAHARRTRLLFEKALGKDVAVGIIAVPNPDYDKSRWWLYSEGVKDVGSEALAYVYVRLFFHPSEPPRVEKVALASEGQSRP